MAMVAARVRTKPKRRLPPEILPDTEVLAVMRACGESDTGVRNQALTAIMYRSGLRVAEVLGLLPLSAAMNGLPRLTTVASA